MRAAGVSILRLCGAVLLTALLLLPFTLLLGEWIGAAADATTGTGRQGHRAQWQHQRRPSVVARGCAMASAFLHAEGEASGAGSAVTVFEFRGAQELAAVARSAGARQLPQGGWQLDGIVDSRFGAAGVSSSGQGGCSGLISQRVRISSAW